MRLQTNLVRRGSRFYYRGRVPEDLRAHYGKAELIISLKTADRHKADYALAQIKARLLTEYAKLRDVDFVSDQQITVTGYPQRIALSALKTAQEQSKSTGATLSSLISYWASQTEKRPRTLMEVETARKRLVAIAGHDYASLIEKQHVIAFKDRLLEQGRAVPTIQKQLNLLKAVYEVAVSNDLVAANPFRGVKLIKPRVAQKARVPFNSNDLKRIFNSQIFMSGDRPFGGKGEAAVWIPRIALWTGMRLEEIGQLTVADIKTAEGIPYIHVTDAGGFGKKLKTTSSRRRIPIHPELLAAGFLGYVANARAGGHGRLFPLVISAPGLQTTASWSSWFGRYLRNVIGIKDPRKCFHSFRHGFKEACRVAGIPKELHDQLTGHATRDVGDSYGGDAYPIKPLADAVNRIRYQGSEIA